MQANLLPSTRPVAALSPSSTPDIAFAYLPFQPATSNPPPWESITTFGAPLFRLKRTSNWQNKPGKREAVHRDQRLGSQKLLMMVDGKASMLEDVVAPLWDNLQPFLASRRGPLRERTTIT
jgi:hypothetical protein